MTKKIFVYADYYPLTSPELVGTLFIDSAQGEEKYSFEYDQHFLRESTIALDPQLAPTSGRAYRQGSGNFGVFQDSAPDRWGRQLMLHCLDKKKEDGEVAKDKRLFESDFLLGVQDITRMGGLRFKAQKDGPFLDNNTKYGTPPFAHIRELEAICAEYDSVDKRKSLSPEKFSLLVIAGTSLGGARPKVSVKDLQNELWIAKFPKSTDDNNQGAWEMVAYDLAKKCGISVADQALTKKLSKSRRHDTFFVKRFDRVGERRIHFCSAMTMLEKVDGDNASSGVSYLHLAEWIQKNTFATSRNLKELWKRIVFHVMVSNTDDHLRNHGFLLSPQGWVLSPAYDINPNPEGRHLSLNIDDHSSALDLDLCLSVAEFFELKLSIAKEIIQEMSDIVGNWREVAVNYGISNGEISSMASAFSVADNYLAIGNAVVSPNNPQEHRVHEQPNDGESSLACSVAGCNRKLRFSEATPQARIDAKLCSVHFKDETE